MKTDSSFSSILVDHTKYRIETFRGFYWYFYDLTFYLISVADFLFHMYSKLKKIK